MSKKKSILISLVMCILLAFTPVYAEDFGDGSGFRDNSTTSTQHHKLKEKMERNLFAGSFHCVKI